MLKRQILACMFTVLGILYLAPSSAATLSFSPASSTVSPGGMVDVDVVISDLFDDFTQTQTLVGGFDIYVNYDPTIVSAAGVQFSNALGLPDIETFSITDAVSVSGQVNTFNLSLLGSGDLAALQTSPSFTLVTLTFQALQIGTSSLEFDPLFTLISDDLGLPIDATLVAGDITVVPLPGAVWLMITGLLGIGAMARRRKTAE